ncbi:hypothetical protein D3C76_1055890 [compost metagenome]
MGKIAYGLHNTLEHNVAQFIEQEGKRNGAYKAEYQVDDAHRQCIANDANEGIIPEQLSKIVQADPVILQHGSAQLEILECHQPSPQGNIRKHDNEQYKRNGHGHESFLLLDRFP